MNIHDVFCFNLHRLQKQRLSWSEQKLEKILRNIWSQIQYIREILFVNVRSEEEKLS